MYVLLIKLIIDGRNAPLSIIPKSSVIKKRKRIGETENSYEILILILNRDDLLLKILIVIVRSN